MRAAGARRSKAVMTALREELLAIVTTNRPCSARQVYYAGIGRLWDKDRGTSRTNYQDVCRNLGVMRESGMLSWGWLVDTTRYVRIDTMYESTTDAMNRMYESYRRDLWSGQPRRVEVWAESDSTAVLVEDVTRSLGVGLFSCRGQAGKEFAYSSAQTYLEIGKPVTILYLGDWDPSGLAIPRSLEERLNRYGGDRVEIDFTRFAVTPEQITEYGLQTHDVNDRDSSYKRFAAQCQLVGLGEQAVEVEAFAPTILRQIIEAKLYSLVEDPRKWNNTLTNEDADRELLASMAASGWSV